MLIDVDFRKLKRRHSNGVVMKGQLQIRKLFRDELHWNTKQKWTEWEDVKEVIGKKGDLT
jgi:hypothetical protein